MRRIDIKMTQAAKERLKQLKNPDELLLPLDRDELRPFDFVFHNNVLCVTFENRKIAFVADHHNGDTFPLFIQVAPDPQVDAALTRFFDVLTRHMDAVGRLLREEKREEKKQRDTQAAAYRAEQQAKVRKSMDAARHLWVHKDEVIQGPVITHDDLIMAGRFKNKEDAFDVMTGYTHTISIHAMDLARMQVRIEGDVVVFERFINTYGLAQDMIARFAAEDLVFNEQALRTEIINLRDRNQRIVAADASRAFIEALPLGEYAIENYVMDSTKPSTPYVQSFGDVTVRATSEAITFQECGCDVHTFSLSSHPDGVFPKDAGEALNQRRKLRAEHPFTKRDLAAIGNLMLCGLADSNPEMDFEVFKTVSVDRLVTEVEGTHIGYGL